jgi:hypothetical protein
MYPYYKSNAAHAADDIAGAQGLYGPPQSPAGGSPATPALPTPAPALTIAITSRAANFSTAAASVSLAGTASGGSGTLTVTWSSDRGGSGAALGAANWLILSAPLAPGANHIKITLTDATGATASQMILITSNSATSPSPLPTPPSAPHPHRPRHQRHPTQRHLPSRSSRRVRR